MKEKILLVFILLFGCWLRFYQLGAVPQILNPDEASIGYNAFLLKETGRDEWQKKWPLVMDAFGDQKVIGYPFLVVLSFMTVGVSDAAVRLPSALAGTGTILVAYFFGLAFFKNKKSSLLLALGVACLPIFIFYSRVAYEANVALFLVLTGLTLLFLNSQGKRKWQDLLAVICFLFAVFIYNSPLLLLPFFAISVAIYRGIRIPKNWLIPFMGILAVFIVSVFILASLNQQKSKITIFGDETVHDNYTYYRASFSGPWKTLVGNKYIYFSGIILEHYWKSFDPRFVLYNSGGHPWHSVPQKGYLNWTTYLGGLVGMLFLLWRIVRELCVKTKFSLKKVWIKISSEIQTKKDLSLIFLFFTSLVPAVITVNAPHATRSLLFFYLWVVMAVGLFDRLLPRLSKLPQLIAKGLVIGVLALFMCESCLYFHYYFSVYGASQKLQSMFQPGYQDVLKQVESNYPNEMIAVIDDRGFQYILTAWYLKLPPDKFYATVQKQLPDKINFKYGERVGHYHFIAHPADRPSQEKVLIGWDSEKAEWMTTVY
jgi:4-amino-4-deoxy-L-arabinose transferase-like glycosyltransferase